MLINQVFLSDVQKSKANLEVDTSSPQCPHEHQDQ